MLYSIVAALVIILDQAVKNWVSSTLFGEDVVRFIPGVLSLVNVQNDGAAFSFLSGSGARIYFIIVTGVFTVAVIIALATNFISGRVSRWSLVLVTAGGLTNCIDRIIYGYVQDMFKVELFDFAIFNVADIFITVFAIIFAIAMIFERQEDDSDDEYYDEEEEEKPKRTKKDRKPLFASGKAKSSLDEDEEEEEEMESGRRKSPRAKSKSSKRAKYDEEYEQYKASQKQPAAAQPAKAAKQSPPVQKAAAPAADPFAEWERANASVATKKGVPVSNVSKPAPTARPVQQQAAPRKEAVPQASGAVRRPSVAPASQPAPVKPAAAQPAAAKPAAPKPAPQPKSASSAKDDFDLDDILAEFK